MDDRAIGLIGLMRRAGAIEIGEDNSSSAVSAGKAKLLLTAAVSAAAMLWVQRFPVGNFGVFVLDGVLPAAVSSSRFRYSAK